MSLTRFFHPVLKAKKLGRKPVRVTIGGEHIVLFRDENGKPAALKDRCAHRFSKLSSGCVKDGRIHCPYHNWSFDALGQGKCPSQPTLQPSLIQSYQVQEKYGCLWVADHEVPVSKLPDLDAEGYDYGGFVTHLFEAPLHVVLANFSEDEHLPYVHRTLGWPEEKWGEVHFEAHNHPDHTQVFYRGPQRPNWNGWMFGNRTGDLFHNYWETRFDPVQATFDMHWSDPKTGKHRPFELHIPIFFVPEGPHRTRLYSFHFAKVSIPWVRKYLMPYVWWGLNFSGKMELKCDADFMRNISQTPESLAGMSLGRFDKPIIHNQRLLERNYYGGPEGRDSLNSLVQNHLRDL